MLEREANREHTTNYLGKSVSTYNPDLYLQPETSVRQTDKICDRRILSAVVFLKTRVVLGEPGFADKQDSILVKHRHRQM
jgi:hypothetical protein